MKKLFLVLSITLTVLLISFSCKKKDTTPPPPTGSGTTGSTGVTSSTTSAPDPSPGVFAFNSITNVGYGGNFPTYSYNASASFWSGPNRAVGGVVSVYGITFTQSGYNYTFPSQSTQSSNFVVWSIGAYAPSGIPAFNYSPKQIPVIQEAVGDSLDRSFGKPYAMAINISPSDSVKVSLTGTSTVYGSTNINRDSIFFTSSNVHNATFTLTGPHPLVSIVITSVNYKDTTISGKKYQFSSRKITATHASCKN